MKRLEHMIWIRLSQTDQPVAVGPKVGPPGPYKTLWGPQKALLGAPEVLGGLRGTRFGPNCHRFVGLVITTHFGLVSGLFWAPRGPKRVRFGPKCPFWVHQKSPK